MKIQITASTQVGGVWYEPGFAPKEYPDHIAQHLVDIGSAKKVETKIVEKIQTKAKAKPAPKKESVEEVVVSKGKKSSAASRPARASSKTTASKSKKPASSQSRSTTTTK